MTRSDAASIALEDHHTCDCLLQLEEYVTICRQCFKALDGATLYKPQNVGAPSRSLDVAMPRDEYHKLIGAAEAVAWMDEA